MAKANKEEDTCCCSGHGHCKRCGGGVILVVGVLIVLNSYYPLVSWPVFVGIILALLGLKFLILCKCCCR